VAPTESDKIPFVGDFEQTRSESVKEWHEQLYSVDIYGVTEMIEEGFNYLDRKWVLQGENAGPLSMEFESKTTNYFVMCAPPGRDQHFNASTTKWTIDGNPIGCKLRVQSQKDGAWPNDSCSTMFALVD
jgi:hypothetical protein